MAPVLHRGASTCRPSGGNFTRTRIETWTSGESPSSSCAEAAGYPHPQGHTSPEQELRQVGVTPPEHVRVERAFSLPPQGGNFTRTRIETPRRRPDTRRTLVPQGNFTRTRIETRSTRPGSCEQLRAQTDVAPRKADFTRTRIETGPAWPRRMDPTCSAPSRTPKGRLHQEQEFETPTPRPLTEWSSL